MRLRRLAILVSVLAILAASPLPAVAAGPQTVPMNVRPSGTEGFESTLASDWKLEKGIDLTKPSTAYWGKTTGIKKTGTTSLWCAGVNGSGATRTWGTYATYPAGSFGFATLSLPQLANFYSATLEFHYNWWTRGAADRNALVVEWADSDLNLDNNYPFPLTAEQGWTKQTFDLSSPLNAVVLSREPGRLRFQWSDTAEGPKQSPTTGRGAVIDDVSLKGYWYAAPRNVAASVEGTHVVLTWRAPATSTLSTADDTRTMAYRVWRSPQGTTTAWTELTTRAGVGTTRFVDNKAAAGSSYKYIVQAWSPAPQTDAWGMLSTQPAVTLPELANKQQPSLTLATSATTTNYGAEATLSGALRDPAGTLLPGRDVQLQVSSNGTSWTTARTIGSATGSYSTGARPSETTHYRLRFAGDGSYDAAVSPSVKIEPKAYLTTPSGPSSIYLGKYFTSYGYLKPRHTAGSYPVRILLYRYEGGKYVYKKSVSAKASDYSSYSKYTASVKLPYAGKWRIRAYHYDAQHAKTYSSYRYVTVNKPKAYLTVPTAPSTTYLGRTFTSYGYLKPRHTAGTYPVKISAYRYEGGRWVYRKSYAARVSNYSSYSKYVDGVKLPYRGRWRIRAYHADAAHAASYSGYRYVTVK